MEKQHSSRLWTHIYTPIVGVSIVFLILFVVKSQTERFHDTLYIATNLLSSQEIYLATMQRTILSVALYAFGMSCIFLYFISYETDDFLNYARIFWYASGLVISLWDYEAVFCTAKRFSWLWRICADIYPTLLALSIFCTLIDQLDSYSHCLAKRICHIISICNLFFVTVGNLQVSRISMRLYLVALSILVFSSCIAHIRKNGSVKITINDAANRSIVYLLLVGILFLVFIVSFFKYATLSKGYSIYLNFLGFGTLIYVIVMFARFFQCHRTGFLLGGDTNRKILEITRHKKAVTKLILDRCKIPIENLLLYREKLPDYKSSILLNNISREIDRLKYAIDHIENFHYLYGKTTHGEKIKTSITALIHYTFYILEKNGAHWSGRTSFGEISDQDFVLADPSLLIQTNETFLSALLDVCFENEVSVSVQKIKNSNIRLIMQGRIHPDKLRMAKRIKRTVSNRSYSHSVRGDMELNLWIAKNNIWSDNKTLDCRIVKRTQGSDIIISYELDGWSEQSTQLKSFQNSLSAAGKAENQKKIILLSTAPEQIEMIQSYLELESHTLLCFSTEKDVLHCIEHESDIGIIIIGTIFFFANIDRFCAKIRESHSIEQLPILIITHDKYKFVDNRLLKYVNDIMTEPFGQIDLTQKIQLLLLLQKSALETVRAKLDFLQAQMDPHFIFNTLSTIMPLCLQQPMQAYEMLTDFSQYLRGRLYANNLQQAASIAQEVGLIQAYLAIEKVRFAEKIDYSIHLQADENIAILPLLIEPIVENSVKHGIKGNGMLNILVDIVDIGNFIHISVKDNGKGIPREKLERLMADTTESSTSIGIRNVRKRLAIYYNQPMFIQSIPDIGTETTFKIPKSHFLTDN